jgi:hypothetical protein
VVQDIIVSLQLRKLSLLHHAELRATGPALVRALTALINDEDSEGFATVTADGSESSAAASHPGPDRTGRPVHRDERAD